MITGTALAAADAALASGAAVVLPNPYPLTSVVAAERAETVNAAKGRLAEQAVALWLADPVVWAEFRPALGLDEDAVRLARTLLVEERLTALLPVDRAHAPGWVLAAARGGFVLVFGSCWAPLGPLLTRPLRVSSANRTGHPPVTAVAEALAVFPPDVYVHPAGDGAPAAGRAATTTVRVTGTGLTHVRAGAQDRACGGPAPYLRRLRERYQARIAG